jgi:hypothetical protein
MTFTQMVAVFGVPVAFATDASGTRSGAYDGVIYSLRDFACGCCAEARQFEGDENWRIYRKCDSYEERHGPMLDAVQAR